MDDSKYTSLDITRDGALVTVTLNRPEVRNVVDEATHDELAEIFTDLDLDDSCEVVVLTGAGGYFCGGGDMDWPLAIHRDSVRTAHGNRSNRRIQKSLLDKSPAVARAIALASTESLHFCVVNPAKCVDDFVAQNQGRDIPQTLAEWNVAVRLQYGFDPEKAKTMKPAQLGWYDAAVIAKTLPELKTLFNIKKDFDPTTLYTNQFVERP